MLTHTADARAAAEIQTELLIPSFLPPGTRPVLRPGKGLREAEWSHAGSATESRGRRDREGKTVVVKEWCSRTLSALDS